MIERTDHDDLVILTLRHGKANTIDLELFQGLAQQLDDLDDDPRPIVLTGQGKMFSAGVDLFKVLDGGKEYLEDFLPVLSGVVMRFFTWPAPVVAAINGHALAGGCILAAACDARYMRRDVGKIGVTEMLVGVPFPVVALEVLRHLIPNPHLESLVKFGTTLDAAQAQRVGLVDEAVSEEELMDTACAAARRLGRIPHQSFALTKRHLRLPTVQRMDQLAHLDSEVTMLWEDDDVLHNIRTFIERTVGKK